MIKEQRVLFSSVFTDRFSCLLHLNANKISISRHDFYFKDINYFKTPALSLVLAKR